ncbi:MAG: class I SAM-dependent methyltransferase [Ectothiorhodospiraceae bacterium]|nr:class I SAM-dependent methyltransferase [Chromatiales bacterium]MCP5154478.1 class I SAM-dependent methyltransferase [Ectothiorhodospiraceae bacterium]
MSWAEYYRTTSDRPPRRTLLSALDRFEAEPPPTGGRRAVDLGCGGGRDTVAILAAGFAVLAIDAQPSAIDALRARDDLPADARLETRVARFEDTTWPEVDLVNSSFALPLVPPERFPALWDRVRASLAPGGRFSGQLFGDRDSFAGDPGITTLDERAARALLAGLEVEMFEEEETDSVTPRGRAKHWHLFHVVARHPPSG